MNELVQVVSQYGLDSLLDYVHALILLVESDGRLIAWNRAFGLIRNSFPQAIMLGEFLPADEREELLRRLVVSNQMGDSSTWTVEVLINEDGDRAFFNGLLVPLPDERVLFVAERISTDPAFSETIERLNRRVKLFRIESEHAKKLALNKHTELEAVIAQAQEVSNIDSLTFLPNRRQIIRELQNEVLRAERYHTLLSVSMVDVDHFKKINDTHGHMIGDHVLRQIAQGLREHVRHPDVVGRYGGEEFLILLPNTGMDAAAEQAARLCKQVKDSMIKIDGDSIPITVSIGVAQYLNGKDDWQTLLTRADNAMYASKNEGRNRWTVSDNNG